MLTKSTNFIGLLWSHSCITLPKGPVPPAKYFGLHNSKKMIPCHRHHPKTILKGRGLNTGCICYTKFKIMSLLSLILLFIFFGSVIHGLSTSKCIMADQYLPNAKLGHLIAAVFEKWSYSYWWISWLIFIPQLKAALKRHLFSHRYEC